MASDYQAQLEKYVAELAGKTDGKVIQLFYSVATAALAYFCIAPVAAISGGFVYFLLSVTRYGHAFWAVACAMFTYKGNKNLAICFVAIATFLYVRN